MKNYFDLSKLTWQENKYIFDPQPIAFDRLVEKNKLSFDPNFVLNELYKGLSRFVQSNLSGKYAYLWFSTYCFDGLVKKMNVGDLTFKAWDRFMARRH